MLLLLVAVAIAVVDGAVVEVAGAARAVVALSAATFLYSLTIIFIYN